MKIAPIMFLLCLFLVVSTIACSSNSSQLLSLPTPTPTSTSAACSCAYVTDEYNAESCVWNYLLHDAATTYNGKQVQAALADAFNDAFHGYCHQSSDGSWDINTGLETSTIDNNLLLSDIVTKLTTRSEPYNNHTYYNTEWTITSEGCIEASDGNAIRLLTALQN